MDNPKGPMSDERWQRLWDLFHEALEQPVDRRDAFLERMAASDPAMIDEVGRLLASHGRASGLFASGSTGTDDSTTVVRGLDRLAGARIGPYHLIEILGEGGMGVVYTAQQERPVRRRVALKLCRMNANSREVLARFEAERQALAILDHPRIAKVFDAGVTDEGNPYFVMEYVPGIPVTEYCDLRGLDLKDRLALFSQACEAIDHAHRKGIIHRDIKPSNLLVASIDGVPSLKVIDFGVAKAMGQPLSEQTLLTQQGVLIGTPEYMSPEQAGTTQLEVDPRTDVYSLGVLLYELLAGALPFDPRALRRAAMVEMLRIIREEDPPTPSARIAGLGGGAEEIARRRHLDVRSLAKQLRGELEWITMRALEKDPARRYHTARELSDDVGRFLDNRPVAAGPPSLGYRAGKFVRRRRTALATAGVFLLLAASLGSIAWFQSNRLNRVLERAQGVLPSPRLVIDEASGDNTTGLTADGLRLLRYDTGHRGYETVDMATNQRKLLTHDGPDPDRTFFNDHDLSPGERRLAAVLFIAADTQRPVGMDNDGGRELRVFEVGGSGPGRLLQTWGPRYWTRIVGWTPDGSRVWVWVVKPDRSAEISSVDVRDGSMELLTKAHRALTWGPDSQRPSLSPDGRFIAYHDSVEPDGPTDVYIHSTDGGEAVQLGHGENDSRPIFAPDGSGVVFLSERRPGFRDLWFQPLSNGKPVGTPRIVWADLGLWNSALRFGSNGSLFFHIATNSWDIFTVDPGSAPYGSAQPVRLEAVASEMNTAPRFSPDGRFLAHLRGARRVVVRDLDSGREREFPVPRVALGGNQISWFPDGKSLVVTGWARRGLVSWRVDLERGGAEELPLRNAWSVACLGTDDLVYVSVGRSEEGKKSPDEILRTSLVDGSESVLFRGNVTFLKPSPDGSHIAFGEIDTNEARLRVMSSNGGEAASILTSPVVDRFWGRIDELTGVMWTPDSRSLLVARQPLPDENGRRSPRAKLQRVALDGRDLGQAGTLHLPVVEGAFFGAWKFDLHPDGRRIAFEQHTGLLAQTWALDGLMDFIHSGKEAPIVRAVAP